MRSKVVALVGAAGVLLLATTVVEAPGADARSATGNQVATTPRALVSRVPVAAHHGVTVRVTGRAGVPARGVSGVLVQLTASSVRRTGAVVAYAAGTRRPEVHTLSVTAGRSVTAPTAVRIGRGGRIALYNASAGRLDLSATVLGYITSGTAGGALATVTPHRAAAVDLGGHGSRTVTATGVPHGARAVAVELTVPSPRGSGYVTAYRPHRPRPSSRSVSFSAGRAETMFAVVPVSSARGIRLYNGSGHSTRVVVDVLGYVRGGGSASTGSYVPTTPTRLVPTSATLPARGTRTVVVAGHGGVPRAGAAAAYLSVTVSAPAASGTVSVAAGQTIAYVGGLTAPARRTSTATVLARMGADGTVVLKNSAARAVRVAVHVLGYVSGRPAADVVAPPSVSGLVVTPSLTSTALTWTDPGTADLHDILVRRATGVRAPATPSAGVAVADVRAPGRSAKDTGLARNATYSYAVFARDAAGNYARAATRTVRLLPSQTITGRVTVTGAGAPAGGVRVTSRERLSGKAGPVATTAADGRYTLVGVAADTDYVVCFDARGVTTGPPTGYAAPCLGEDVDDIYVPERGTRAGADAQLDTAGEIDGVVTDPDGTPLTGVVVTVGPVDWVSSWSVRTDGDGRYAVRGLRPGFYGVCFDPAAATGGNAPHGYAPQCLAADPFAPLQPSDHEVVSVSPGATSRGDIALGVRPTLSGTVRGPGGAPLKGATVTITTTGDYDDVAFRATTQADGTYLITWDGNTSDRMCFTPPATVPKDRVCVDEIYGLVSGFRSRTHIDYSFATAPVSSTVVGKVTDAAGRPMGGVTVRPSVGPSSYTTSAKDGTYRLTGLDAVQGDSICFTPSAAVAPASATGYLARCVDGVDHLPGHTVTVDAALHRGGAISGVVTDPRGTPLPGLTVSVGGLDVGGGGYPTTDAYGRYSITGLPPDRYVVGFLADGAYSNQQSWGFYFGGPSVTGYLDECWNDIKPYGDCSPVTVSEGHAVTGLNAALSPAGGVSGTVRDAQGHPLRHVRVDIFTNSYDDYEITDLNGHYTGVRLPLGSYRVCAESEPDTSPRVPLGYTRRCFKDAPDAETGTGVTVTSGRIAPGVDITMQPEPVGSASGRVTDQDGGPLGGVLVNLGGAQTHSRPDGTYDLANVPVGSFAPCFDPPAADGGAPAYVAACGDPVDIAADQSTDVPMEQLVPAGAITGVVRDDQGTPVTGALVSTLADPWAAVPEAHTDADGRYRIAGLAPGDYRLYYGAPTSADFPLESRWAGGGLDSSTALVIHVDSGATEEHDETLSSDGAVTGAVRDSSGTPLPFATVTVAGPNGFAAVTTGADGTYRADVPPGDYSVCFATERSDAAMYGASSSCFGDTGGGAGQPVTVVGRQATSGIDGSLQRYGGYTVHVTDAAGHALAGVEGSVSDTDGNLISWGWRTDGFGSAAGGGLAPGTYVVSLLGYDAVAPDGSTGFGNADLSLTVTAGVGTDLSASLAPE